MAHWHLLAFRADDETLAFLESPDCPNVGPVMHIILTSAHSKMSLRENAGPPTPEPVYLDEHLIGAYLGYHYDGLATGLHVAAPLAPPGSVIVTVCDSSFHEELRQVSAKTLALTLRVFQKTADGGAVDNEVLTHIVQRMDDMGLDEFARAPERTGTLVPILYNDSDTPVPIYTLKIFTFLPGEEGQMIWASGYPFGFREGHISPRRASDMKLPETAPQALPTDPQP
jgi:hypothetical protein